MEYRRHDCRARIPSDVLNNPETPVYKIIDDEKKPVKIKDAIEGVPYSKKIQTCEGNVRIHISLNMSLIFMPTSICMWPCIDI